MDTQKVVKLSACFLLGAGKMITECAGCLESKRKMLGA
jgi:hypothetical protein